MCSVEQLAVRNRIKRVQTWYSYLVRCSDGSYYTGISTDVERRVRQHNTSKLGARYTRGRRPVVLVYWKSHFDRSTASREEFHLKQLSHGLNLSWRLL